MFGLLTAAARVLFGASLGRQIDKQNKLTVVAFGTMTQATSIALSACLLFFLLQIDRHVIESNIFATWWSSVLFCVLLLSAMVGSLAAMVMDVSVERV